MSTLGILENSDLLENDNLYWAWGAFGPLVDCLLQGFQRKKSGKLFWYVILYVRDLEFYQLEDVA